MLRRVQYRSLFLILILALLLRLIGIATRPIWYDEAFSLLISEKGPNAILSGTLSTDADSTAAEEHPPLYYFLLWGWMQAFKDSVPAARALSLIAGLAVVVLVYFIARQFFDETSASVAALFAATLPFQVHYAQEIRMYIFLALWIALAILAFIKRKWILFAVSAALAQYTHNLAAFYLIPLALIPLFQRDWKTLRAMTLAGFAATGIYSPWLIQLPAQLGKVEQHFWIQPPGVERFFTLLLLFLPHLPLSGLWLMAGLAFAVLIIAIAVYQTYLAIRRRLPEYQHGLWFAYLAFVPPLLLWTVSQWIPVYVERALLPSHVMFCIWLAWALTKTQLPRAIQSAMYVLIFASAAIGIYQHVTYNGFPYGPFVALDRSLNERFEAGDVIIHSSKLSYLPAFYFDPSLKQSFVADAAGSDTDTLSPTTVRILGLSAVDDMETATAGTSRVWFIIYQESMDEFTANSGETHPQLKYLDNNLQLASVEKMGDLRLYLFTRPAP